MQLVRLLAAGLVFILPFAKAFSDTYPIIAWSSLPSRTLSRLSQDTPAFTDGNSVLDSLLDAEDICAHDLVILVTKPGLHANHMRNSHSNERIATLLEQSSSSIQLPHVSTLSTQTFEDLALQLSNRCGHQVTKSTVNDKPLALGRDSKHVLCMEDSHGVQGTNLMDQLESMTRQIPKHLVIMAGIPSKHHSRRQLSRLQQPSSLPTSTSGGIFKRYQLFTPTLLTALLIFVLIWIPIVFVALKALSSIQVPRIGSIGKPVSAEKKNQ